MILSLIFKETFTILLNLVTKWFGFKNILAILLKKKDLKEAFKVCLPRWGKGVYKSLYVSNSLKYSLDTFAKVF